jgi:hypothetical protein
MTLAPEEAARRAERLLRWYPKSWRIRYGDEFAELLTSELTERPRSPRRAANVMGSGVLARLTNAGLTGHTLEPRDQVRAGLTSLGWALAVFLVFGIAMWSQLTIGWQWASPDSAGTTTAMVSMSGVLLLFGLLALLAAVPIAWTIVGGFVHRRAHGLVRPSLLFAGGMVLLVVGARHFGNGWPGTGGHPWSHQGLVPGGAAAFLWASTLSVTSYWAHPGALAAFPVTEVAWMVMSPVAIVGVIVGATKIMRRLEFSVRVLRYEGRIGRVAAVAMAVFLVASWVWMVDGGPGPRNLFHAGAIDAAGLLAMTVSMVVASRAVHRAHRAGLDVLV